MSNELAKADGGYTAEQVSLIKRTIAKDATDDELRLFVQQCERSGLDPFAKQIHFVKRQGKMTIQTGIDGYRLIADRTGRYVGNDDPVFDDEDSPSKATVTVYKLVNGIRCPFTASARWAQYYPGKQQGFMWEKMPHVMLGKCAEALALRKAFPQELSGLYTNEEMAQAGHGQHEEAVVHARPVESLPAAKPGGQHQPPPADTSAADELIAAIADATTLEELDDVGESIGDVKGKLSKIDLHALRAAWQAKRMKLSGEAAA